LKIILEVQVKLPCEIVTLNPAGTKLGLTVVPSGYDILAVAFIVVLVAGFVTQVPAQTDPCLDRTIPVNVYTKGGEPVTALTAANFKASIKGKPIVVTATTYDRGPRSIVILIDVSGSMTERGRLKWGLEFAQDLISSAPSQDSLALLTFSNQVENAVAFGQSRTALLAEIDKLQHPDWDRVKGMRKTAMEDALLSALAVLKTPRVGDAICLVTDGGENASQSRKSNVEALLELAGVRVYAILPTWHIGFRTLSPEEAQGPSKLRDLASATGGVLLMFVPGQVRNISIPTTGPFEVIDSDRQELASASQAFHREISSFNILKVRLPERLTKPRDWNLDVVDASGQREKDAQVLYPQRLAPCTLGEAH
jgi:hypothetical protein